MTTPQQRSAQTRKANAEQEQADIERARLLDEGIARVMTGEGTLAQRLALLSDAELVRCVQHEFASPKVGELVRRFMEVLGI